MRKSIAKSIRVDSPVAAGSIFFPQTSAINASHPFSKDTSSSSFQQGSYIQAAHPFSKEL
jgi:hypothetical protein